MVIKGDITEATRFDDLLPALVGRVDFDLSQVRYMNSLGVREWVEFLRRAPIQGYEFHACSVAFVLQAALVEGVTGRGTVSSFFAPYACDACDHTDERLLQTAAILATDDRQPPAPPAPLRRRPVLDDIPDPTSPSCNPPRRVAAAAARRGDRPEYHARVSGTGAQVLVVAQGFFARSAARLALSFFSTSVAGAQRRGRQSARRRAGAAGRSGGVPDNIGYKPGRWITFRAMRDQAADAAPPADDATATPQEAPTTGRSHRAPGRASGSTPTRLTGSASAGSRSRT